MRRMLVILGLVGCLLSPVNVASGQFWTQPTTRPAADSITVYFSPNGGCTDAIVKAIGEAKKTVRIQAYSFTSAPIAKAIIDAKKRGIQVTAILDRSNRSDKYSAATFLSNQGATVLIDDTHAIAHNKIILIDDKTVITGSFNFSANAEDHNAENLLIIKGADVAKQYDGNFANHLKHAKPYEGLASADPTDTSDPKKPTDKTQQTKDGKAGTDGRVDTYGGKPTNDTTPTGLNIYEGPRGGRYHISSSGKKVYEKKRK